MNTLRETVLRRATSAAGLPATFADALLTEAPWLDGTEEVNEDLGPELLADPASLLGIERSAVERFVHEYNALVRAINNPHELRQSEAYVAFGQVLSNYGREDVHEEGDYWLVSDSFSTRTPVVVLHGHFRPSTEALAELQESLNQYASIFSELRLNTEEGGELYTLRPA